MKIIQNGSRKIADTWAKGVPQPGVYRLVRYAIRDRALLHSCVTGKLVELNAMEQAILDRLPCAYTAEMDELIADRFLVPVEYDEKRSVDALRKILRMMRRETAVTSYTILPTTYCNARCFYCYQSDFKHASMSAETAHRLVEYMIAHSAGKPLKLNWFGGEPLVGVERIRQICGELTEKEIPFWSTMVSNGYLFDADLVREASEQWHLKRIQITLDGPQDVYDRVKNYTAVNGSPFQRVLENIGLLLDAEIRVSVRLNLDKHNMEDLRELIELLAERFGGRKGFKPYSYVLYEDLGFEPIRHEASDRDILDRKKFELDALMEQKGLRTAGSVLPILHTRACMADIDAAQLINPDGGIGKCGHFSYSRLIGDLDTGANDQRARDRWKEEYPERECCADCPLYPVCVSLKHCPVGRHCTDRRIERELDGVRITMRRAAAGAKLKEAEDDDC